MVLDAAVRSLLDAFRTTVCPHLAAFATWLGRDGAAAGAYCASMKPQIIIAAVSTLVAVAGVAVGWYIVRRRQQSPPQPQPRPKPRPKPQPPQQQPAADGEAAQPPPQGTRAFKTKLTDFRRSVGKTRGGAGGDLPIHKMVQQTLATGDDEPAAQRIESARYWAGAAEMTGRRDTMEDATSIRGRFRDQDDEDYFALFDGHGNRVVALYCKIHMHQLIAEHLNSDEDPLTALGAAFEEIHANVSPWAIHYGTTALVVLIRDTTLYCANVGDTRLVLATTAGDAKRVSLDHKVAVPEESARVVAAGGTVTGGRINSRIAITRAIGDSFLSKYLVAEPHVATVDLEEEPAMDFLILACDGVWDVIDDKAAVAIVAAAREKHEADAEWTAAAAEALRDAAYEANSGDNISVLVVARRS